MLAAESAGLSPRTVSYIRAVSPAALNRGAKWGVVARNPTTLTDPPGGVRTERSPPTHEEARRFLDAVKGERLAALYRVAPSLGVRQVEALSLSWDGVDLDSRSPRVRRALRWIDGKLALKEPRTEKGRRALVLPAALVPILKGHRDRQGFERAAMGDAWVETGLVFSTPKGTPVEPSNVLKQFKAILERAGLSKQRLHDLRQCAASLMLTQGVPMRVIMDVPGHTQVAATADLSSHVMLACTEGSRT